MLHCSTPRNPNPILERSGAISRNVLISGNTSIKAKNPFDQTPLCDVGQSFSFTTERNLLFVLLEAKTVDKYISYLVHSLGVGIHCENFYDTL